MTQQIMLLAFFITGIVTGVVTAWLILRSRIAIVKINVHNQRFLGCFLPYFVSVLIRMSRILSQINELCTYVQIRVLGFVIS